MKKTRLLTILLMAMAIGMGCTSCTDLNASNRQTIAMAVSLGCTSCTEKEGEDDTGIEVNLRNANSGGGEIWILKDAFLGGNGDILLRIDESDNFNVWYNQQQDPGIICVGSVSGLSKVSDTPSTGSWISQYAVKKGYGYVIRGKATDGTYRYARVYVVDILTGASSGGIIGDRDRKSVV